MCFASRTDSSNQAMNWWILLESRNKAMDAWQFAKGLALWSEIWSYEVEIQKRKPIMGKEGDRGRCKIRSVACSTSQAEHVMDLTYVKTGKPRNTNWIPLRFRWVFRDSQILSPKVSGQLNADRPVHIP